MPSKVQLKLVSNTGELLHVVTCNAGSVSVLRASSASELRPYQRALGGSQAKDNLEVMCDGVEYVAEHHTVIGFGEPSPTKGLTVREFLTSHGVSELSIDSTLLSIGLEGIRDKRCSDLNADQEARLRLLAATTTPERVLVLNDPFEAISSQWRERTAEMLVQFARSQQALIIVPALTYRPECWIDNESIQRIEVGQTSQRTIGFGAAGSSSNALIHDLRDKLRNDPRFKSGDSSSGERAAGVVAGAVLTTGDDSVYSPPRAHSAFSLTRRKVISIAFGVGVGGLLAVVFPVLQKKSDQAPPRGVSAVAIQQKNGAIQADSEPQAPATSGAASGSQTKLEVPQTNPLRVSDPAQAQREEFLLDRYPAAIRLSLINSVRGREIVQAQPEQQNTNAERASNPSGNLFSLLEKAGSDKADPASAARPGWPADYPQDPQPQYVEQNSSYDLSDASDEERRREEIRSRFLEAIRAAAARRQAAMEAESDQYSN